MIKFVNCSNFKASFVVIYPKNLPKRLEAMLL